MAKIASAMARKIKPMLERSPNWRVRLEAHVANKRNAATTHNTMRCRHPRRSASNSATTLAMIALERATSEMGGARLDARFTAISKPRNSTSFQPLGLVRGLSLMNFTKTCFAKVGPVTAF
jgi:hypothetical protein